MMRRFCLFVCVAAVMTLSTGCIRYQPDYPVQIVVKNEGETQLLLQKAEACAERAENAEELWGCIAGFEQVIERDPLNHQGLVSLANLYLLWGDGYVESKKDKAHFFRRAMYYSERIMYLNPAFRRRIDAGERAWQASEELTEAEIDALVFWSTAVFYYYKEVLGPVGQVLNYPWIRRAKMMLERAEQIAPEWGGGIISMSWGLLYLSLPEKAGGDRLKSARYFEQAIAIGPLRLVNRWARAKYFHVKMGDRIGFRTDLQWVLDQDLETAEDHMAWKRFFVADAGRLLEICDVLFPSASVTD